MFDLVVLMMAVSSFMSSSLSYLSDSYSFSIIYSDERITSSQKSVSLASYLFYL